MSRLEAGTRNCRPGNELGDLEVNLAVQMRVTWPTTWIRVEMVGVDGRNRVRRKETGVVSEWHIKEQPIGRSHYGKVACIKLVTETASTVIMGVKEGSHSDPRDCERLRDN